MEIPPARNPGLLKYYFEYSNQNSVKLEIILSDLYNIIAINPSYNKKQVSVIPCKMF